MILALDCATKTGWCFSDKGKICESGVEDFSKRRGESNGIMFIRFRSWLTWLLDSYPFDIVVYEQAHHRGGAATEICVNLTGRVQEMCDARKIEYMPVHTRELKKWACGKGNADKGMMIARAREILGRDPIDDNEADAVLLEAYTSEGIGRGAI